MDNIRIGIGLKKTKNYIYKECFHMGFPLRPSFIYSLSKPQWFPVLGHVLNLKHEPALSKTDTFKSSSDLKVYWSWLQWVCPLHHRTSELGHSYQVKETSSNFSTQTTTDEQRESFM